MRKITFKDNSDVEQNSEVGSIKNNNLQKNEQEMEPQKGKEIAELREDHKV